MKTLALCMVNAVLFYSQLTYAQTETSKNTVVIENLLETYQGAFYISSSKTITNLITNQVPYNTAVKMQQIGNYNTFMAELKSNNSDVSVIQKGNNNTVLIDKQGNSIDLKVLQQGNYNIIHDFSTYSQYELKSEFIQNGNNQTINNFGSNSISRDLKVIQSGNGASVILINNLK